MANNLNPDAVAARQREMKARNSAPKPKRLGKRALASLLRDELNLLEAGHPRRATILAELALMGRTNARNRQRKADRASAANATPEQREDSFRGQGHVSDRNDQFGVDIAIMHLSSDTRHSTTEPTDEMYAVASRVLKIECPVRNYDRKRADQLFSNYVPIEETLKMIESRGTDNEYTPRTMRELCA
jgi:hypothetical protein